MTTITLPWFHLIPGYRGHLVVRISLCPLRVQAWRMSARLVPPAPGSPADVARALAEVGR